MQKNSIIIGVILLIVGLGVGYGVGAAKTTPPPSQNVSSGMHMMPNGSMMGDNSMGDMGGAMDDMMAGLQGKKGDEFDKAFLSGMIMHHQGAVAMAEAALKDANHAEIKQMAQNIISAQTSEISQMQQWQKDWYNQ